MIDKLLDPLLAPFRLLRSKVFQVKQIPATFKGGISRAQGEIGTVKGDFKGYAADAKSVGGKAQQVQGQAGNLQVPKAKKKMGLFGGKKCPSCGQKLHASWEECPYCGWGKQGGAAPGGAPGAAPGAPAMAAPAPGGKQRTMALNIGGAADGVASDGILGWFIPMEGKQAGELFTIKGRVTVGSAPDNDIVMADSPSISGHHAEFVGTPNGFKLNDLGSTNGTFVNDKRVNTHELVDNDNVKLGKVNFKFKSLT